MLFGFAALLLCGVGDWLIGYDPPGGQPLVFVMKGQLKLPKAAVVCCPLGMSLLAKVIGAVLLAAHSKYAFLTACGESWGWAFLCLAFYAASKRR